MEAYRCGRRGQSGSGKVHVLSTVFKRWNHYLTAFQANQVTFLTGGSLWCRIKRVLNVSQEEWYSLKVPTKKHLNTVRVELNCLVQTIQLN